MQIPLDYYRILGIPLQVSEEQISQAYYDRSLQLPRREYSEFTINARRQLLDEAFGVLSDPQQRSRYEQSIQMTDLRLGEVPPEQQTKMDNVKILSSLDISPEKVGGALLILQELGEYELVSRLGESFLSEADPDNPLPGRRDLMLTLALSSLELSREQWQGKAYEKAAFSGHQALKLLKSENIFPKVQEEIQRDLDKLRPYRIFELLSEDEDKIAQRSCGLQLLKEMLHKRQGIDGRGDDGSGLGIDDFLGFIQQLRVHLTVKEQQDIFEVEALRPSDVATYLSVYALIAGGFTHHNPAAILKAENLLNRLSRRQDVSLEQGICLLLLGQTEAASQVVKKSQDQETLAFIEENSHGAEDLLPGLCSLAEKWLQVEVFAYFKDLKSRKPSLRDYFAEESVQDYLEQLPLEAVAAVAESQQLKANSSLKESNQVVTQQKVRGIGRNDVYARSQTTSHPQVLRVGNGGTIALPTTPAVRRHRGKSQTTPSLRRSRRYPTVAQPVSAPPRPQPRETVKVPPDPTPPVVAKKKRQKTQKNPKLSPLMVGVLGVVG